MDKQAPSPDGRGTDSRPLLVVFNPVAGRRHRRRFHATLEALRRLDCVMELRETEGAGHAGELAAAADPDAFEALVVAGGDGTINEAINGLIPAGRRRAALPLAVVPLGTANVLAAEIGLSTQPESVARTIAGGRVKSVALGRANGRLFTIMAGVGFDTHVVEAVDTALKRRIGKGAYLWQSARQLLRSSWPRYQVEIDGRCFEAASVIVAKGRLYAGRFVVAPDARLEVPEFQVCLFGRGGAWNALRYAAALGLGLLPRLPDYHIVPGRAVTIEGPAGDPVQGDGDVIARLPLSVEVLPGALDLIVPS